MPYLKRLLSLLLLAFAYVSTGHAVAQQEDVYHPQHPINYKFSPSDAVQRLGVPCVHPEGDYAETLPTKVNNSFLLKVKGQPYISDQGALGACTAHACQYAILGVHGQDFLLSRLGLYGAALRLEGSYTDSGTSLYSDFRILTGADEPRGYFREELWTYDPRKGYNPKFLQPPPISAVEEAKKHKIVGDTGLAWVGPDLNKIKISLANGYFLPFGMQLRNSFMRTARDGRVPPIRGRGEGGHAMCFTGYDDTMENLDGTTGALRFRNSWGAGWGDKGDGYLPYSQLPYVVEAWAVRAVTGSAEAAVALKYGFALRAVTGSDVIIHPATEVQE